MNTNKFYAFVTLSVMYFSMLQAQVNPGGTTDLNFSGRWIIGAGINMIEDSGHQKFGDFFTFKKKNLGTPFYVSAEYLINNKMSVSTTALFNKYQSGKQVQGLIIQDASEPSYFAVDVAGKLFVWDILAQRKFTPYFTAGMGYRNISTYEAGNNAGTQVAIPKTRDITLNTGLGAYYWLNNSLGLNFNYIAKFAMKAGANKNYKTNHLVSSFGVFYRFSNKNFD
jgi:outer membrane protein W